MATAVLGNVAFPSRVRMGLGSASPFRGRVTIPGDRYVQPSTFTLEDAFRVSAPGFHQAPYLGIPKIVPPSDEIRGVHSHDSHGCPRDSFRPAYAKGRSRSVFEVSHLLDGLHHRESCGFVAPRCRSWDSPSCDLEILRNQGLPRRSTLRSVALDDSVPVSPESALLPFVHQGKRGYKAFRRRTSPLRRWSVAEPPCPILPWVFPFSDEDAHQAPFPWNGTAPGSTRRKMPPSSTDEQSNWRFSRGSRAPESGWSEEINLATTATLDSVGPRLILGEGPTWPTVKVGVVVETSSFLPTATEWVKPSIGRVFGNTQRTWSTVGWNRWNETTR